jgi:hypothetical protein
VWERAVSSERMPHDLPRLISAWLPCTSAVPRMARTRAQASGVLQRTALAPTASCPGGTGPSGLGPSRAGRPGTARSWGVLAVHLHGSGRPCIGRHTGWARRLCTARRPVCGAPRHGVPGSPQATASDCRSASARASGGPAWPWSGRAGGTRLRTGRCGLGSGPGVPSGPSVPGGGPSRLAAHFLGISFCRCLACLPEYSTAHALPISRPSAIPRDLSGVPSPSRRLVVCEGETLGRQAGFLTQRTRSLWLRSLPFLHAFLYGCMCRFSYVRKYKKIA